jgi:hypothetical protein
MIIIISINNYCSVATVIGGMGAKLPIAHID